MLPLKENFFRECLVPAGQLLTVLQDSTLTNCWLEGRCKLGPHFDTLNLVACYAFGQDQPVLGDLRRVLNEYIGTIVRVLATPLVGPSAGAQFRENGALLLQKMHLAIGYDAKERHRWVTEHLAPVTPLTEGGRLNKWRTFVRNGSWEEAARLVEGTKFHNRAVNGPKHYGNRVGIEKAAVLWDTCFREGPPSADYSPEMLIPRDIKVMSVHTGLLRVSTSFDPRCFLDVTERGKLDRHETANLVQLAVRNYSQDCVFTELAVGLEAAKAWLAQQQDTRERVRQAFTDWLLEQERAALRAKVRASFTTRERDLLQVMMREGNLA